LPWRETTHVARRTVDVVPGRAVSAIVWGADAPEIALIHGGAQNAHTWDTVALALGRPLVAVDPSGTRALVVA
jgi:pimeloyl-ACP methyl ester carboxylesterase